MWEQQREAIKSASNCCSHCCWLDSNYYTITCHSLWFIRKPLISIKLIYSVICSHIHGDCRLPCGHPVAGWGLCHNSCIRHEVSRGVTLDDASYDICFFHPPLKRKHPSLPEHPLKILHLTYCQNSLHLWILTQTHTYPCFKGSCCERFWCCIRPDGLWPLGIVRIRPARQW